MSSTLSSTTSLPDTLADTLSLALKDARSLDHSTYLPHCLCWHGFSTDHPGRCVICLAGSIISQSFNVHHHAVTTPGFYPVSIERKLRAVNLVRTGNYYEALTLFHTNPVAENLHPRLAALPIPAKGSFIGWIEFEAHLDSIEELLPVLRTIERDMLADTS